MARRMVPAALLIAGLGGCHWDMWNNAKYRPYEASKFFDNKMTARSLVAGTVQYKQPRTNEHLYAGKVDGVFAKTLPLEIKLTADLLKRGQDRFNIYCIVCHGETGYGNGIVVQRGFPAPPSYHIDRLRQVEIGYFFDTITNGFGRMYSYASRVKVEDRWAIAAYIRALQLSQNATEGLVPAAVIELAKNPPPVEEEAQGGEHGAAAGHSAEDGQEASHSSEEEHADEH